MEWRVFAKEILLLYLETISIQKIFLILIFILNRLVIYLASIARRLVPAASM